MEWEKGQHRDERYSLAREMLGGRTGDPVGAVEETKSCPEKD